VGPRRVAVVTGASAGVGRSSARAFAERGFDVALLQLAPQLNGSRRRVNLYEPADADADHGAHGRFDDHAGGFFDPSFLKTLPDIARTLATAVSRTAAEKGRRSRAAANTRAGG
jgi:NAD(P)-dependent dehydrogenase (short-subunit alcohol dehydrogenase family)